MISASILTLVNIALAVFFVKENGKLRQAMETHLDACRRIRDEILPMKSINLDAIRKIDEHIEGIKNTNRTIKELLNEWNNVHRQRSDRLNRDNQKFDGISVHADTNSEDAGLHQGKEEHHESGCAEADADCDGAQAIDGVLGEADDKPNEVHGDDICCPMP